MTDLIDGLDARNSIIASDRFDSWAYRGVGTTHNINGLQIQLVENHDDSGSWNDGYNYEGRQGWTGKSYLTFQVIHLLTQQRKYFRQYGTCDSYGDNSWDLEFVEVQATMKTVEVFEQVSVMKEVQSFE